MLLDRPLPHSGELEEALLSAMMLEASAIDVAADTILPEHIYTGLNRIVFEAMIEIRRKNLPADLPHIVSHIRDAGKLEACGGALAISRILDSPASTSVEATAMELLKLAARRRMIEACASGVQACYEPDGDAVEVLDRIQARVTGIECGSSAAEHTPVRSLLDDVADEVEARHRDRLHVSGLPTGFALLDFLTCGWQPSDLIIIAARPSMGKTALALRMAETLGLAGIPGDFYSLEMSKKQLVYRMAASRGRIDLQNIRSARMSRDDFDRWNSALSTLSRVPVFINDTPGLHYSQIRRLARASHRANNTRYIMVDHMQLMRGDFPSDVNNDTGSISRALKGLAKELDIPVIVLSQLNRKLEERPPGKRRPMLSDLRNSGNIEQDADVVMFIHREEVYSPNPENKGKAEFILAKHRNGPTGFVEAAWFQEFTRFEQLER